MPTRRICAAGLSSRYAARSCDASPIRRRLREEGATVAPRVGTHATWDAAADGTLSPARVHTVRHPYAGPSTGGEIGSKKCAHRLRVTTSCRELPRIVRRLPCGDGHHAISERHTDPTHEPFHVREFGGDLTTEGPNPLRVGLGAGVHRGQAECARYTGRLPTHSRARAERKRAGGVRLHDHLQPQLPRNRAGVEVHGPTGCRSRPRE